MSDVVIGPRPLRFPAVGVWGAGPGDGRGETDLSSWRHGSEASVGVAGGEVGGVKDKREPNIKNTIQYRTWHSLQHPVLTVWSAGTYGCTCWWCYRNGLAGWITEWCPHDGKFNSPRHLSSFLNTALGNI